MALTQTDKKWIESRCATKDDLKAFATKEELKALENRIVDILDVIVKKIEKMEIELVAWKASYDRHENKLENHEKRISALEVASPSTL